MNSNRRLDVSLLGTEFPKLRRIQPKRNCIEVNLWHG